MVDQCPDDTDDDAPDRVNIDYIKGTLFRTISPTGLIGSTTAQGKIQIALYSERQAIPRRETYALGSEGELGEILEIIGRDAVVRELEAVVTLDSPTAKALAGFLSSMLRDPKGQVATDEQGEDTDK